VCAYAAWFNIDIIVDTERELTSNNKITTTIFLAVRGSNSFIIKYQRQFAIKIVYGTMLELARISFLYSSCRFVYSKTSYDNYYSS
jgi:hypothetical protein